METFTLTMNHPNLSRDDFRKLYKEQIGNKLMKLPYAWTSNLANVLQEIVKNFYDHAHKQGVITVQADEHEMSFEAYDFGPGYQGEIIDVPFAILARYHTKHGSSLKETSQENAGLGLAMIEGGLQGLKTIPGVTHYELKITTSPHFSYVGKIRY